MTLSSKGIFARCFARSIPTKLAVVHLLSKHGSMLSLYGYFLAKSVAPSAQGSLHPRSRCHYQLLQLIRLPSVRVNASVSPSKLQKKDGGFLNYKLGDDLHCGLVDTRGTVTSFVPNVEVRRELRSWEQAIIVIPSGLSAVSADHWDGVILKMRQQVRDNFPTCEFDCLDFAVMVLNEALQRVEFNRNSVSELMCRQLKHVMHYANLQREAMLKQL